MLIEALVLYEHCLTIIQPYFNMFKQVVRNILGPEPICYYLLNDGYILPSNIHLPDEIKDTTFVFDPLTNKITKINNTLPEGRFKPLPYIGIQLRYQNKSIDISDWVGDIRANPIPDNITPKQLTALWFYTNNRYVPLSKAILHVVKNDGSEEDIELD